jgi:hypothetical protein
MLRGRLLEHKEDPRSISSHDDLLDFGIEHADRRSEYVILGLAANGERLPVPRLGNGLVAIVATENSIGIKIRAAATTVIDQMR